MRSLFVFLFLFPCFLGAQTALIPQGAEWDYYNLGDIGNTELGYGEGDENTVVQSKKNVFEEFELYDFEERLVQLFVVSELISKNKLTCPLNGIFLLKIKHLNRSVKIHCYD